MIVQYVDQDGDPVAIDTALIVGVSVGRITGPRDVADECVVTLIWAQGASQPFMVATPFEQVLDTWERWREQEGAPSKAYPGVFPLVAHQYPTGGAK